MKLLGDGQHEVFCVTSPSVFVVFKQLVCIQCFPSLTCQVVCVLLCLCSGLFFAVLQFIGLFLNLSLLSRLFVILCQTASSVSYLQCYLLFIHPSCLHSRQLCKKNQTITASRTIQTYFEEKTKALSETLSRTTLIKSIHLFTTCTDCLSCFVSCLMLLCSQNSAINLASTML